MTSICYDDYEEFKIRRMKGITEDKREREQRCRGGCFNTYHGAANAQGLPRAGNVNMPGWLSTFSYKFSHRVIFGRKKERL